MNFKAKFLKFFRKRRGFEIDPDEIFLDSRNLPNFDVHQFEGRIEKPISDSVVRITAAFFVLVGLVFLGKLWVLQIKNGEAYSLRSENNNLKHTIVFAERGIIFDRNKKELAWNEKSPDSDFSLRVYTPEEGFAHVLGYLKYPQKDSSGFYYQETYSGKDGVEEYYDRELAGVNGLKLTETDVSGKVQSESVLNLPKDGEDLTLALDKEVQEKLYDFIKATTNDRGFEGGAGVILDVHTGGILALTSYPEYDSNVMTAGTDKEKVQGFLTNTNKPFLDRAISGLYIPGSIIKPFIAMGVLEENIIDPLKQIQSTGSISIPNPYNPSQVTIFRDWKVHGWVDLRDAIAVSSDEYFYTVGGGYGDQKGIGISNINKYVTAFGFEELTNIDLFGEAVGIVPSPEWKERVFDGDPWRLGDTYNSSIGQYGFQTTIIQAARAAAAFGNGGTLLTPTVLLDNPRTRSKTKVLDFDQEHFKIIREGMRQAVTDGTAGGLNIPGVTVAAKTGTAELGITKQFVNSWVIGFFPYENPRFAFAVLMERGPRANTVGATYIMRQLLDWMVVEKPEYVK